MAVRNIWDATPEGSESSHEVLKREADDLNRNTMDQEIDYVVCEGSFARILKKFRQDHLHMVAS